MAGNLQATVDYLVTQAQATLGHSRVYNRQRDTRNRQEFESLFVSASGLDFWTVRRESSSERHRGASHQAERTHRIRLEGYKSAQDQDLAANSAEIDMQNEVEALVEMVRTDPHLGWSVEHAQAAEHGVEDAEVAGVAVYRGFVVVEAREALHW